MSEELNDPANETDDLESLVEVPYITPLQALMGDLHEIYEELLAAGFTERTSAFIVALQLEASLEGKYEASDVEVTVEDGDFDEDDDL